MTYTRNAFAITVALLTACGATSSQSSTAQLPQSHTTSSDALISGEIHEETYGQCRVAESRDQAAITVSTSRYGIAVINRGYWVVDCDDADNLILQNDELGLMVNVRAKSRLEETSPGEALIRHERAFLEEVGLPSYIDAQFEDTSLGLILAHGVTVGNARVLRLARLLRRDAASEYFVSASVVMNDSSEGNRVATGWAWAALENMTVW